MDRRKALVASAIGAALVVATVVLAVALVTVDRGTWPGADAVSAPDPVAPTDTTTTSLETVTVYEDVYETIAAGPGAGAGSTDPGETPGQASPSEPPGSVSLPAPSAASAPQTATTAAPRPATSTTTTTTAPATPATRPPEIPEDWPADKPLPPLPPNCREPHLEDNGVWNCQH